ncbi:hypothetical protein [uncultured Methylobacterium sp.]|uniref:hypothetical protein n=1 Tax=uncultured Methylobacterium sp. TaxID=157278 RepID=UPI0035C98CD8
MSRSLSHSAIIALGLVGGLVAAAPVLADAPPLHSLACAQAGWNADRAGCRTIAHRRAPRPYFAQARASGRLPELGLPLAGRYVSLLILGVGY